MKHIKYLLSLLFIGVLAFSSSSCGGDDEEDFGGGGSSSSVLAKGTIGIYNYEQKDYATWLDNGMVSNSKVTLSVPAGEAQHQLNISIDMGRSNAPFDKINQGDTFECTYRNPQGVSEVNVDAKRYTDCVSGKITCTQKTATTMILTLSNVVMERSANGKKDRCEINGTLAFKK